ncbi:MAG: ankyrin repeat domain-containing protein [Planctomycetes bacterium]|nr:ankyrin repeat domain-containing protein [Planctomycetota bacterium]
MLDLDAILGSEPSVTVNLSGVRRYFTQHPNQLEDRGESDKTPLLWAVALCQPALVRLLIDLGANVNPQANDGFPPLHLLVDVPNSFRADSLQIAAMVLEAGADIEQRGINDWTPLHRAANAGNLDMVRLLVEHGADLNARTRIDGHETPIMEAALRGQVEVIEYLLQKGADPTLVTIYGETAEQKARSHKHPEVVRVLQSIQHRHSF